MKKRLLSVLLCVCLTLPMLAFGLPAAAGGPVLYGDANNDRNVDLLDILLMEKHIAGEQVVINETNADVNSDGAVDREDVRLVREYLAGNLDSLTPDLCTVSFDAAGGSAVAAMAVGRGYSIQREIPSPAKEGLVFAGWVKGDGSRFYQEDPVTGDMTLTATYEAMESQETLSIDSFSLSDQSPDVTFRVTGAFASAEEARTNLSVVPKDGSDPVEIEVRDEGGGDFTVKARDGYAPGASYELTLNDGLRFEGKDEMFRTAAFIIKKAENDRLYYNENLIFLKDTDAMTYTVGGATTDVLEAGLFSDDTETVTGTFTFPGGTLKAGDYVCIYETEDPRNRDYTDDDYEDDSLAYIRVTAVAGSIVSFESLGKDDADQVLRMPDSIPFRVDALPAEGTGTADANDYDAAARTALGFTQAPQYREGDFLIFYTEDFAQADENTPVRYARVTAVDGSAVHFQTVDKAYIDSYMGMFVSTEVDADGVLAGIDRQAVLNSVQKQAARSGFVNEASDAMIRSALKTDTLQNSLLKNGLTQEEIAGLNGAQVLAASGGGGGSGRAKLTVEGTSVVPTFIKGSHFDNGIGLRLDIGVTLSVDKKVSPTKISSLKIELSAGFEQEIAVSVDVNVEDEWKWYAFIPVLKELSCYTAVDIQSYSSVSVGAKLYTVSDDVQKKRWDAVTDATAGPKTQEALRKINKLGMLVKKFAKNAEKLKEYKEQLEDLKETLPKVVVDGTTYSIEELENLLGKEDISTEFEELLSAGNEDQNKVGVEKLMDKYVEMLNQESDWVELYNRSLYEHEFHIKIVAIKISVNFIVRANVNLSIGADVEYQVGKRYNFWVHVIAMTSGSSEMDLNDERFGFQFYVMGALGLKAGVKAEVSVGLISTKIASIGANVEFGPYLRIYGYFFYIFTKLRPANTDQWEEKEEMQGALYLEFGLYLTVKFKAQAFDNAIKYEPTLYDKEFPLLTAGVERNVYDFAYAPSKDDVLYIADSDADSRNGIAMALPEQYRVMKTLGLRDGTRRQGLYELGKFQFRLSSRYFSIDQNGVITAAPPEGTRYMKCDLSITWKSDKLAFSAYDMDVTVPLVWTNLSESELKEKFTASVAVGNPAGGYDVVWSGRYSRVQPVDLPSREEILKLIGYDGYDYNGINLKYSGADGYRTGATQGLSLTADTVFYFDVAPREYTLNVRGVQKADGTTETRAYRAAYGKGFALSGLRDTGTDNPAADKYTSFLNLTEQGDDTAVFDPAAAVDLRFYENYGFSADLNANYADEALTATYQFSGISAPEAAVKFRRGEIPYFEGLNAYVEEYGGAGAEVTDISPVVDKVEHSIRFTVSVRVSAPKPKHTLTFDTRGGDTVKAQQYPEGAKIFRPADPGRTGYAFAGWHQDAACTQPFSFDTPMPERDLTLYAKWTANTYTLTLVSGSDTISQRTIAYDSAYGTLPEPPGRTDFKFVGWYTQSTGGEKIEPTDVFKHTENVTLHARWTEKGVVRISYTTPRLYTYDAAGKAFAFTPEPSGLTGFVVAYKVNTGGEWSTELPVVAGTYDVKVTRPTDNDYKAMAEVVIAEALRISKAAMTLTGRGAATRGEAVRVMAPNGLKGDGAVTYHLQLGSNGGIRSNATGFFTNIPRDSYTCWVEVAEGTNYAAASTGKTSVFVSGFTPGSYSVDLQIKTMDNSGAGTDDDVNAAVYYLNNTHSTPVLLDKEDYNDFERDDEDLYSNILTGVHPWEIMGYKITKESSSDEWGMDWAVMKIRQGADYNGVWHATAQSANCWFTGDNLEYSWKLSPFRRDIWDRGTFSTAGGDAIDLTGAPPAYAYNYNGTVKDQFYSSGYDCMEYFDPPEFSVASGSAAYDRFIRYTGLTSFEVDTAGLAAYIRENGGSDFQYTVTLRFPERSTTGTTVFTKSIAVHAPVSAKSAGLQVLRTAGGSRARLSGAGVALAAAAGAPFVISAEKINALKGQTVEVPVRLEGGVPFWGVLASVGYDRKILELAGYTIGNVFREDAFTLGRDTKAVPYRFLALRESLDDAPANGELLTLKFKVKDDAGDQPCTIDLRVIQAIDSKGTILAAENQNGTVVIDSGAPVISGVENGKTYYGPQTVTVQDENLLNVTVNGEEISLTNGQFVLYPAEGSQTVTAVDLAGYKTSVTVIVSKTPEDGPKTGDTSDPLLWFVLAFVSGGLLTAAGLAPKKNRRNRPA